MRLQLYLDKEYDGYYQKLIKNFEKSGIKINSHEQRIFKVILKVLANNYKKCEEITDDYLDLEHGKYRIMI